MLSRSVPCSGSRQAAGSGVPVPHPLGPRGRAARAAGLRSSGWLLGIKTGSVRYLHNTETGEITADQEAYIDTLLAQYNMTECNANKVPLKTSVNLDEIAARLPRTPHRGRW